MAGKSKEAKKKYCLTEIPKSWPKFTGPAYKDGMTIGEANRLWGQFLREHEQVGVTPKVYRGKV